MNVCKAHHCGHMTELLVGSYLIPCLCLSNENKGIGGDDGEAEVNEDDGALRTNVPAGRSKKLYCI